MVDEGVVWREVDGVDESRVKSVEWFESGSCCAVDGVQESVVESVEWLEIGGGGVVDGGCCGLYNWLDVGFVLVHECLG